MPSLTQNGVEYLTAVLRYMYSCTYMYVELWDRIFVGIFPSLLHPIIVAYLQRHCLTTVLFQVPQDHKSSITLPTVPCSTVTALYCSTVPYCSTVTALYCSTVLSTKCLFPAVMYIHNYTTRIMHGILAKVFFSPSFICFQPPLLFFSNPGGKY